MSPIDVPTSTTVPQLCIVTTLAQGRSQLTQFSNFATQVISTYIEDRGIGLDRCQPASVLPMGRVQVRRLGDPGRTNSWRDRLAARLRFGSWYRAGRFPVARRQLYGIEIPVGNGGNDLRGPARLQLRDKLPEPEFVDDGAEDVPSRRKFLHLSGRSPPVAGCRQREVPGGDGGERALEHGGGARSTLTYACAKFMGRHTRPNCSDPLMKSWCAVGINIAKAAVQEGVQIPPSFGITKADGKTIDETKGVSEWQADWLFHMGCMSKEFVSQQASQGVSNPDAMRDQIACMAANNTWQAREEAEIIAVETAIGAMPAVNWADGGTTPVRQTSATTGAKVGQ